MRRFVLLALLAGTPALAQSPPPPTATSPATTTGWLPRDAAELQALDKVYARSSSLIVKNGATASFGTLSIAVSSCYVRPPDQAADATAYITIADGPTQVFQGWMFAANPALDMLAHAIYDIRLTACRP